MPALLGMTWPFDAVALTCTVRVTLPNAPGARLARVTEKVLPEPMPPAGVEPTNV